LKNGIIELQKSTDDMPARSDRLRGRRSDDGVRCARADAALSLRSTDQGRKRLLQNGYRSPAAGSSIALKSGSLRQNLYEMRPLRFSILILAVIEFAACASKETLARRDREDAQRDLEYAREQGQRAATEYNEYLVGYARGLGKTPSQLTQAERDEAHHIYWRY